MKNKVKILILGSTGFVGQRIVNLLLDEGSHSLICAGRNLEVIKQQFPEVQALYCDLIQDVSPKNWLPRLEGIDIIINCAGIFFHQDKKIIWNIHFNAPKALYEAALHTKVQKIIHLSALGVDLYSNEYAASKRAIEEFLRHFSIPHIILRPSLIYGPGAKGGIAAIKKMASLPGIIPLPSVGKSLFQPIYVGDLAKAIKNLISKDSTTISQTLAAVSCEKIQLKKILLITRDWLKISKGRFIKIPDVFMKIMAWWGDKWALSIMNTQAVNMLKQGNYTTHEEAVFFQQATDVKPLDFASGLNLNPASAAERWFLRLILVRPVLRLSLAIMWLVSSLTSVIAYTRPSSYALLSHIGLSAHAQPLVLYSACLLNFFIGCGLLLNYKVQLNCIIQMAVILLYSLLITLYLPYLWLEPFGPIVKNIPVLLGIAILYILES